MVKHLDIANIF